MIAAVIRIHATTSQRRMMGAAAVGCRMIWGTQLAIPGFNTDLSTWHPTARRWDSSRFEDVSRQICWAAIVNGRHAAWMSAKARTVAE
jgi:hypothetical protein